MLSKEILKKIAEIEIHTKRIMRSTLMGDSRSAQKGSGFEFNQIREYQMGDDVRFIDWRASARSSKILVKEYIEERNRTIMILLDISKSTFYTSSASSNAEVMKQAAAILAFVAGYSKDRVGLLMYSDSVECLVPPAMGHTHVHTLLERIFSHEARSNGTNGALALNRLKEMKIRDSAVFLVSDCIDEQLSAALKPASRMNEVVVVRCLDHLEKHLPRVGFLPIRDPETGQECLLDMRGKRGLNINWSLENRELEQRMLFAKYGIDCLDIVNNDTFIGDVVRFFRRRMTY
jgi:uncharacterized protein (DUF58 family)